MKQSWTIKKGQRVQILDGSKRQGIVTAVEAKKGFRGQYDYNEIYVTLDAGDKVVHNDWQIRVIDEDANES